MTEHFFDHDRLDVYRLSIEYVANAFDSSRSLEGLDRHARDQWLRATQSIPLNLAEGNGKRSLKDRAGGMRDVFIVSALWAFRTREGNSTATR